mmetsp:Transcript_103440/g.321756  ORF Transcript_103440/g.321756 Transcript_103440/m.321756 type:complete len:82 (-) Transcript_103440:189-434(-)
MVRLNNLVSVHDKNPLMQDPYVYGTVRKMGHTRQFWGTVTEHPDFGPNWYPLEIPESKPATSSASGEPPKSRFPFFDPSKK